MTISLGTKLSYPAHHRFVSRVLLSHQHAIAAISASRRALETTSTRRLRPRRSPGQQIAVVLPDGKTVQAVVPPNAVPGTVFHIQV